MEKKIRTVKRYLGKALLTGVAVIGMAATSDQPAIAYGVVEGTVKKVEGGRIANVVISDAVNGVLGETNWLGNFSIRFELLEGEQSLRSVLFRKDGYEPLYEVVSATGGTTTTYDNPFLMTPIE